MVFEKNESRMHEVPERKPQRNITRVKGRVEIFFCNE